jgi:hypothetical protein
MSSQQSAGQPTDVAGRLSIVAITCDNSTAHGYINVDELLGSKGFPTPDVGVEFFDSSGRRLAPVFDARWQLIGLQPTADEPDLRECQRRLSVMVEKVNSYVSDNPDVLTAPGREVRGDADAGPLLSGLRGMELTESLQAYAAIIGHVQEYVSKDPGGPLHNLFHAMGGKHN